MKRWTNGLPGATKGLGANLALRGLSVSQSGCARIPMMARSKIAPLQRPNTLMQLSRSSVLELTLATRSRAIHIGTTQTSRSRPHMSVHWGEAVKVTPHSKCRDWTRRRHGANRYSITSSARCCSCKGTSRPSALAVLRLITSSNLTGAWTGSSLGFAPFRILSTTELISLGRRRRRPSLGRSRRRRAGRQPDLIAALQRLGWAVDHPIRGREPGDHLDAVSEVAAE